MKLEFQGPSVRKKSLAHLACLLVISPVTLAQSVPPPSEGPAPEAAGPVRMTMAYVVGPQAPCAYPPDARKRRMEGVTTLRATITAEGAATGISVIQSSGWPMLDDAAVQCFGTWHFAPATRNGVPMTFAMKYSVQWKLSR